MRCVPFNDSGAVLDGLCYNRAMHVYCCACMEDFPRGIPHGGIILHSWSGMACFPAPLQGIPHGMVSRGTWRPIVRLWQLFQRMVAASGATLHRGTAMQLRRAAAEDAYEVRLL